MNKALNNLENSYNKNRQKSIITLIILGAVLVATFLLSLKLGSYNTTLSELIKGIFGKADEEKVNILIRNVRLPRLLTALIAGVGLSLSGCVLQAILKNPLASASTLGISQGAGFGAAFAIVILGAGTQTKASVAFSNPVLITLCAFIASMTVSAIILGFSFFGGFAPEAIVLCGVAMSSLFTGGTTLIQYFADDVELGSIVFWTFGNLEKTGWKEVGILAVVVGLSTIFFYFSRWDYNALDAGEETAISLGVNVTRMRVINMTVCAFTTATIVSFIGIINFIGLIAPHIVRRFVGSNYSYLIPGSALAGGALVLINDIVARQVIPPVVLPIGAVTSFIGAPLFLYLLYKEAKKA